MNLMERKEEEGKNEMNERIFKERNQKKGKETSERREL